MTAQPDNTCVNLKLMMSKFVRSFTNCNDNAS